MKAGRCGADFEDDFFQDRSSFSSSSLDEIFPFAGFFLLFVVFGRVDYHFGRVDFPVISFSILLNGRRVGRA